MHCLCVLKQGGVGGRGGMMGLVPLLWVCYGMHTVVLSVRAPVVVVGGGGRKHIQQQRGSLQQGNSVLEP